MVDEVSTTESTTTVEEKVTTEVAADTKVTTEVEVAKPEDNKVVEEPVKTEIKYDLKLSEGSLLDKARIDEVLAEAKAQGLTNEQAQNLLMREEKAVAGSHKSLEAQLETNKTNWLKALESDKDVGGAKWKENAETAHLFLKQHADQGMMDFLDKTGYGNNPSVFKFVLKLANMAKSDKIVNGGGATHQSGKSMADLMYDKTVTTNS
jgi:hypothetical protein